MFIPCNLKKGKKKVFILIFFQHFKTYFGMFSWNCHNHFEYVFAIHEAFVFHILFPQRWSLGFPIKVQKGVFFCSSSLDCFALDCLLHKLTFQSEVFFSPTPLRLCSVGASILAMYCQLIGLIFILHGHICIFLWMFVNFLKVSFICKQIFMIMSVHFLFSIFD